MLAGAFMIGMTVFGGFLSFSIHPSPWNFPGDPPLFDLLVPAAAMGAGLNVPLWLLSRKLRGSPVSVRLISQLCSIASLTLLVVAGLGILERQAPRWSPLRQGIRHYGDAIATAAGDKHRVLSHEEFEIFKQQFIQTPVTVDLFGYGRVRLRMAHGVYPYVGVDFSDASHALFDPITMWCTYSD
jgi:hypothetical protein